MQAGGGTVADAKPDYEYEESRNKARAVARAIELADAPGGVAVNGPRRSTTTTRSPTTSSSTWASWARELEVVRNDVETDRTSCSRRAPDRVIVSPGPCTPNEAGVSVEVMRRFPEAGVPTLGVCLGHQSLAQAFGGTVDPPRARARQDDGDHARRRRAVRGAAVAARGRPLPLARRRPRSCPTCLVITATGGGVVMGVQHRELPAHGVQFHPESVLTPDGKRLLENFLARTRS